MKNAFLKINPSFSIVAIGFYFIVFCIIFLCWNIDPIYFFLSISSIVLACTFALAGASSKYVEVSIDFVDCVPASLD